MAHVNTTHVVLALLVLLIVVLMVVRVKRTRLCDVDGSVKEIILQARETNTSLNIHAALDATATPRLMASRRNVARPVTFLVTLTRAADRSSVSRPGFS